MPRKLHHRCWSWSSYKIISLSTLGHEPREPGSSPFTTSVPCHQAQTAFSVAAQLHTGQNTTHQATTWQAPNHLHSKDIVIRCLKGVDCEETKVTIRLRQPNPTQPCKSIYLCLYIPCPKYACRLYRFSTPISISCAGHLSSLSILFDGRPHLCSLDHPIGCCVGGACCVDL